MTPSDNHSNSVGLETLPSLPIMNSLLLLFIASVPNALPKEKTTSSVKSLKAIPLISFALNILSLSYMMVELYI